MTDEQQELLCKAQQSLEAAKLLLTHHYSDYATSRAYYTIFYVVEAFLEGEGLSFSHFLSIPPSLLLLGENLPNPNGFHLTSTDFSLKPKNFAPRVTMDNSTPLRLNKPQSRSIVLNNF